MPRPGRTIVARLSLWPVQENMLAVDSGMNPLCRGSPIQPSRLSDGGVLLEVVIQQSNTMADLNVCEQAQLALDQYGVYVLERLVSLHIRLLGYAYSLALA